MSHPWPTENQPWLGDRKRVEEICSTRYSPQRRWQPPFFLQILADSGGSNGCSPRAWKFNLQHRLCNRHGLRVTVAHYPTAASKWNPIEHRLFCEISKNWSGRPLDSYETILKYLRTTRTTTGLRVRAHIVTRVYETGAKIFCMRCCGRGSQTYAQKNSRQATLGPALGWTFCWLHTSWL